MSKKKLNPKPQRQTVSSLGVLQPCGFNLDESTSTFKLSIFGTLTFHLPRFSLGIFETKPSGGDRRNVFSGLLEGIISLGTT